MTKTDAAAYALYAEADELDAQAMLADKHEALRAYARQLIALADKTRTKARKIYEISNPVGLSARIAARHGL